MSIEALQQFIKEKGISQNKVAPMVGVSSAVISTYLKGKYEGDVEEIDKKVAQMLGRQTEKAKIQPKNGFVITSQASQIIQTCQKAHITTELAVIVGDAGLGKTMALKEYARQNRNVVLIEIDPTFSPKVLLIELCEKLGIVPSRSNHDNMSNIVSHLIGTEKLIIIDEAELLTYKSLEIIRRVKDKAGIGLVLAGMPKLRANMRGSRGELKQLSSRISLCANLDGLGADDVAKLSELALGTDEFNDILTRLCEGNARRLDKIIKEAYRISAIAKEPINEDMLLDAVDSLVI